jgi:hypothetical protein
MRSFREMISSTSGGSEGGIILVDSGDTDIRGASKSLLA